MWKSYEIMEDQKADPLVKEPMGYRCDALPHGCYMLSFNVLMAVHPIYIIYIA